MCNAAKGTIVPNLIGSYSDVTTGRTAAGAAHEDRNEAKKRCTATPSIATKSTYNE